MGVWRHSFNSSYSVNLCLILLLFGTLSWGKFHSFSDLELVRISWSFQFVFSGNIGVGHSNG